MRSSALVSNLRKPRPSGPSFLRSLKARGLGGIRLVISLRQQNGPLDRFVSRLDPYRPQGRYRPGRYRPGLGVSVAVVHGLVGDGCWSRIASSTTGWSGFRQQHSNPSLRTGAVQAGRLHIGGQPAPHPDRRLREQGEGFATSDGGSGSWRRAVPRPEEARIDRSHRQPLAHGSSGGMSRNPCG